MTTTSDFEMEIGNNTPVSWLINDDEGEAYPLAGASFVLAVQGHTKITKDSADADGLAINTGSSTVTWTPTVAESRLIPTGAVARYELEYRSGSDQRTVARGTITGVGGLVDD